MEVESAGLARVELSEDVDELAHAVGLGLGGLAGEVRGQRVQEAPRVAAQLVLGQRTVLRFRASLNVKYYVSATFTCSNYKLCCLL